MANNKLTPDVPNDKPQVPEHVKELHTTDMQALEQNVREGTNLPTGPTSSEAAVNPDLAKGLGARPEQAAPTENVATIEEVTPEMVAEMPSFDFLTTLDRIQGKLGSDGEPYRLYALGYALGLSSASDLSKARRKASKAGADKADLEAVDKYVNESEESLNLWKAFYDVTHDGKNVEDAVKQHAVKRETLDAVMKSNVLGFFAYRGRSARRPNF